MNKINPLYLLGIFIAVALLMMYESWAMEKKISRKAQENAQTEMLGKKVASLKTRWKDPKKARSRIDAVLNMRPFASKAGERRYKSGVYKVTVKELSAQELDRLSAKLLNETVPFKRLEMLRNGDRNVTVTMEFAL